MNKNGRCGFTLVELVVVMAVTGVVVSALLIGFYSEVTNIRTQRAMRIASIIADDLMNEIRSKAFCDPGQPAAWAEEGTASRVNYDDVDDYDGLVDSPPRSIEGSALTNVQGFTCSVLVTNVPSTNFNAAGNFPHGSTDFLKVTVSVRGQGAGLTNITVVSRYD